MRLSTPMRLSMGSISVLASNWLFFVARCAVALLLAVAIASTTGDVHVRGLAGALGMFAVTDGALTCITWWRDRRFNQFAIEAAVSVTLGLGILLWAQTARALLLWFALRAVAVAAVQAWSFRQTLTGKDARVPLIGVGLCAACAVGFLIVSAFGFDAVDLYACIAGYLALFGGTLLAYGIKLHRLFPRSGLSVTRNRSGEGRPTR